MSSLKGSNCDFRFPGVWFLAIYCELVESPQFRRMLVVSRVHALKLAVVVQLLLQGKTAVLFLPSVVFLLKCQPTGSAPAKASYQSAVQCWQQTGVSVEVGASYNLSNNFPTLNSDMSTL